MLTSLNVVRMAAVDWDCTSRSATRWRRRDIGTRCSGRAPSAGDQGTVGEGGAFAAGAARFSTAVRTSPLVTRPPRPVPVTSAGWMLWSAIILRAAGSAVAAVVDATADGPDTAPAACEGVGP